MVLCRRPYPTRLADARPAVHSFETGTTEIKHKDLDGLAPSAVRAFVRLQAAFRGEQCRRQLRQDWEEGKLTYIFRRAPHLKCRADSVVRGGLFLTADDDSFVNNSASAQGESTGAYSAPDSNRRASCPLDDGAGAGHATRAAPTVHRKEAAGRRRHRGRGARM